MNGRGAGTEERVDTRMNQTERQDDASPGTEGASRPVDPSAGLRDIPEGLMQIPQATLDRATSEMMDILTSPDKYRRITDNNIKVGRRNFSFDVLRAHLNDALSWAQSFKA